MRLIPIALALLLAAGCGSKHIATVSGTIKVAGESVGDGAISFEPADGVGPTAGGVIHAGHYALGTDARLTPGEKRVRIMAARKTGRMIPAGTPLPKGTMVEEVESINIPLQEVELIDGKNERNFDIP